LQSGSDEPEITIKTVTDREYNIINANPLTGYLMNNVPGLQESVEKVKEVGTNIKSYKMTPADKALTADRIAKGLPIITTGFLSAIQAIKQDDYIACSAALMNICSGTAMLAPPPIGAMLGAFIGSIGLVLNFFVKQEPPLEDKIEKLLYHFKDQQNKETISAVGHSISSYATSLTKKCDPKNSKGIAAILAMPLTSEKEADDFLVAMKGLNWGLERDNVTFDVPRFANWQVAGYLENKDNQRAEGWPEVLGIWCRTYIHLLTANMMLMCLADPQTLDRLINETQETNKNSLPNLTKNTKRECHRALLNLRALVSDLSESWEPDKKEMLEIVKAVWPAAQERGMYVHVGYWQQGAETKNILWTASGTGSKGDLKWIYKRPYAHTWFDIWGLNSISIINAEKDSFTPNYKVFTCESDNRIGLYTLDSVKNAISDRTEVISPRPDEKFLDVSAMALIDPRSGYRGSDATKLPKAYVTLVIENNKKKDNKQQGSILVDPNVEDKNYVNLYVIDEDNKSTRVNWQRSVAGVGNSPSNVLAKDLRSLYLPPTTLRGDPDADAMVDLGSGFFLSYAGVRGGNKIHVVASNDILSQTVEGPEDWTSYNGIEVDPYYLWVFGKDGIACATHASIIKCLQNKFKLLRPSWIFVKEMPYDRSPDVTSLFPCEDGTLVAVIEGNIYTADYEIYPFSGALHIVTSSWVKRNGKAKQVIKMPIPCWPMLQSLRRRLQSG
jgi:hypothetical protein